MVDARTRFCNENQGVVIPNGYQLYISYGYGDFKIDGKKYRFLTLAKCYDSPLRTLTETVGYWNIAGGDWVINWQE